MKYSEDAINRLYDDSLAEAQRRLSSLPVAEGRKPVIGGLNGWIYEQTIRHCLSEELRALGLSPTIQGQVTLEGRVKIDLLIGRMAVEVKAAGSFGDQDKKYSAYRVKVEAKGWTYCYVTRGESHKPYRLATMSIFGKQHAFFLDTKGDWERFAREITNGCKEKP